MKIFAAAAFATALAAPAAAFDNADCKAFLTGSWSFEAEQESGGAKVKITGHSSYNAAGTFTLRVQMPADGAPPQSRSRMGAWDAGPGSKPDACLAKLMPKDEPESAIELTVIDADTVATPDGHHSLRVR